MNPLKFKIQERICNEFVQDGFVFHKSTWKFVHKVNNNCNTFINVICDCAMGRYAELHVSFNAQYKDLNKLIMRLNWEEGMRTKPESIYIGTILHWIVPEKEFSWPDLRFDLYENSKKFNRKMNKLILQIKSYGIPFLQKMETSDGAIEETAALDKQGLIFWNGVIPLMYYVWKHDINSAMRYIEEKKVGFYNRISDEEWAAYKQFVIDGRRCDLIFKPANYYKYLEFSSRFKNYVEEEEAKDK